MQDERLFRARRVLDILVAEDSPIIQAILLRFLTGLGHRVVTVENGREAVGAVGAKDFDVVLMDIRMPEMDGMAATRSIRGTPTDAALTPIIACSADSSEEKVAEFLEAGMNACIDKPVDKAALLACIDRVLAEEIHEVLPEGEKKISTAVEGGRQINEDDSDVAAFLEKIEMADGD